MLVAMSATFWKASRKATAASTVVLGRREQGGSSAGVGHTGMCQRGGVCPMSHPALATHLSWECSLVAFELKSSHMG